MNQNKHRNDAEPTKPAFFSKTVVDDDKPPPYVHLAYNVDPDLEHDENELNDVHHNQPVYLNYNDTEESLISHHPFDNTCKFPIIATYPEDLSSYRVGERLRRLKCENKEFPMASQDSEGYLYVHNHWEHFKNITTDVKCKILIIEGGLRNPITNKGKDVFTPVKVYDAIVNKRLWINADSYLVRCEREGELVWEKPFAGMRDVNKLKNTMTVEKDVNSLNPYGLKLRKAPEIVPDRYSVDVIGFDSTARTMFFRHMPRTVDTMNKLGYHFLYGYNKVGDNSEINLGPIFAGDIPEHKLQPKFDISGDLNMDWIFPQHSKLNPDNIQFLWKLMKEKYGCRTMLNEDISRKFYGLFTYPAYEYLPGFTELPTDHYYRAYYLAVYNKWKYGPCKNSEQVQREFLDLWYRFGQKYKNICHFGFTFFTTLTHESGLLLETLDEYLASRLAQLNMTGALDNSLSMIMSDHGNRLGPQQYTFSGRVEERMPLMAIRLPNDFARKYPTEYAHFLKNKFKLTSNFDIHQTLKDIVTMRMGQKNVVREGRGLSLFTDIPKDRTCRDVHVVYNFCTCMIDRSNDTNVSPQDKRKYVVGDTRPERVRQKSQEAINNWLQETELNKCVNSTSLEIKDKINTLSVNPYVRHGFRKQTNLTNNENLKIWRHKLDYFYYEMEVSATTVSGDAISMLFRIEQEVKRKLFNVVFEPFVQIAPQQCYRPSLIETCSCLLKGFKQTTVPNIK
ncbi:hypothetical protein WR25_08405 [Diploscapter pachys]|uniref:Uncharacterized protein n=1 Tax=Diploscapter pachys TaxID=2018661 RepID=A0A2A2KTW4_9BILA|nr:hypothetical protein WR25_08405 [Diploscapter pachys]